MPAPAVRGVYLRPLPDSSIPASYSAGARRRAAQLQRFLKTLQAAARPVLGLRENPELLVVGRSDWRHLFRYPYGPPFTRTRGAKVSIVAAAEYPPRVLHRFDGVLLQAAKAGTGAPGDVREYLDLLLGHEWGHAVAALSGIRTGLRWFDELMASYLFLAALDETGGDHIKERFLAWAGLDIDGAGLVEGGLGGFEYPRHQMPLDALLWFQGRFVTRASELLARRGWELPLAVRDGIPELSSHRGDVTRTLLEIEPSFRPWVASFGKGP